MAVRLGSILLLAVVMLVGPPYAVRSQAPLVLFNQQTMPSEITFDTPCGLIDHGTTLACAYGAVDFTGIRIFNKLWGLPTLAESIPLASGTYTLPSSVAGNHKGFLLVADGSGGVYCNAEKIETPSVVRPIRRIGQTPNGYFALVFSSKCVVAMEHRFIPGTYYQALQLSTSSTFVAVALSEADGVLVAVTSRMELVQYAITINLLGRITVSGGAQPLNFQLEVPERYPGTDPFFLIRERPNPPPTSTTRGYREVLIGNPASACVACATCQSCPTQHAASWMVLTPEYPTPFCNDVPVTQNDGSTTYCARYDASTRTFGVVFCTPSTSGVSKPTRFSPAAGCVAKWRQQPPYFNYTNKTTNSLWDLPSEVVYLPPPLDMHVPTYITESSLGSFYEDAANIAIANGLVVAAAILQGKDCLRHASTTIAVGPNGDSPFCSEQNQLMFYSVAIPLAPNTGPRIPRQFSAYKSSISPGPEADSPPSVVAYDALNGTTVVAAARVAIATSATSGASVDNLKNMPYSTRTYPDAALTSSRINDLVTVGRDLHISFLQMQRSIAVYKIPRNRVGTTSYYFASMVRSNMFNYSENYAYCATQIEVKVFVVDISQQPDGLITSGAFVSATIDAFVPEVLDSTVSGNAINGYTISLFQAPCAVPTTQTIRMRITSTVKFDVVLSLLPGGVLPPPESAPPAGPTPAPTPPPTPPPIATDSSSSTMTQTATEALTLEASDSVGTVSLSRSDRGATGTSSLDGLTASRRGPSVSESLEPSITPQQYTAEPTLSVPRITFDVLPPNVSDWVPVPPTLRPYPQDALAALADMAAAAPPPSTYVVRFTLPFAGVGRLFVTHSQPSVALGSIVTKRDDGTEIFLRATNATEAHRFVELTAVATNPEVFERNLTHIVPLNVTVWGEEVTTTTNQQQQQANVVVVGWQSWVYPLAAVPLNRGPLIANDINCSRSVVRGVRFDMDLGSVLVHPLHVRLLMSVSGLQFPLPPSIHVQCADVGNCSIRGVAVDDAPIRYRIGASDGFFTTFALCALYPYYLSLRVARGGNESPLVFDVKAADPFVLTIPMDLFISSLSITMLAVTLDEGYPLPLSVNFMPPNTLRGVVSTVQLLRLRVKAVDLFSEAYYGFVLNVTDRPPVVVGAWAPVRILAGQSFAALRYHTDRIVDPDPDDAVVCAADPTANTMVPPWLSVSTVSPGTLQITGNAPVVGFPHDQNITLWLLCSDGVLHTPASIVLHMQEAVLPQPTSATLPQFVAAAEEPFQATIDATEFYMDPSGGNVAFGAALTSDALATWLQIQRVSDTILRLSGVPSVDEATRGDGRSVLGVEVVTVFGNKTVGHIDVLVTATTWQLIVQYSTLIYSLLGVLVSIVSVWFYWVPLVNTVSLPWRRVACPLTTPGMFDEEADGAVSYRLHKTCHDLVGYVQLSDKVAGKLRRRMRCLGNLSSYWHLMLSYEARLPKWLYERGDHRAVFSVDNGDDGVLTVVVHERNIYGVVLREYQCDYPAIVAFLASYGDEDGDGADTEEPVQGRNPSKRRRRPPPPRPLLRDGNSRSPSPPMDAVDDTTRFHDVFCEDEADGYAPTADAASASHIKHGRGVATPTTGNSTETLRDARRAHMRMEAMRHQLGEDMQRLGGAINQQVAQTVDARILDVGERVDGLKAMLTSWMASSAASPSTSGNGRGGGSTSNNRQIHHVGGATDLAQHPLPAIFALDDDGAAANDVDLLYGLDSNRVQDPLAELNRAMATGREGTQKTLERNR